MLPVIESTHGDYARFATGTADGANTVFMTHWGFAPHTQPKVFLNGALQSPGIGEDYLINWSEVGKFTFIAAPEETDKVTCEYWAIGDNS
jgi:hypothetical protein